MSSLIFALLLSLNVSAKEVIRGTEAQDLYDGLIQEQVLNSEAVTSNVTAYFGDIERPHLGRLWLTSIFRRNDWSFICYQYDFRDSGVIEYLCERK